MQEQFAVAARGQARVAQHQHAAVAGVADQASGALLERDRRCWNLPGEERIGTGFAQCREPRFQHRIVRRGERQLVDDDARKRLTGDVQAFPETGRTEQHAVAGLTEIREQLMARCAALHEQRIRQIAQQLGRLLQGAMRGEQHEGAAARGGNDFARDGDDALGVVRRIRIGQAFGQIGERLRRVVERARQTHFHRIVEAELAREMLEAAGDRQRGRSEDPARQRLFTQGTQRRSEVQRRRMQGESMRRRLVPMHGLVRAAVEHGMQALAQILGALVRAGESARAFGLRGQGIGQFA